MSKPRTGAPKRVAVGLLAGALAMFGVALAPPAGATATVTNERLAGATRYGTAAAIAGSAAFGTPTTALVATGANFPDALAASTLAGANTSAPIVLTEPTAYTAEAKSALAALKVKGVTAVTIVGGTSAVSAEVETAIKGDGFTVARVAGDDRYETAAAIAQAAEAKSAAPTVGGLKTAFIATGTNYPDALAAGPGAYASKLPLLLVNDTIPTETSNAIATLGIKKVIILGGTAAVSTIVEGQLVAATGNPATRLAGTNRFGTAAAVGDYEIATLAFPATSAVLATGTNFPDALAAGPLGGALKAPIVLTASLPTESQAFLDKYSAKITKLYVSGGTASIDDATVTAATTAAQSIANDNASNTTVTSRPELVSAIIVKTVGVSEATAGNPAGTTVRYTFDEPVFAAAAGSFKVYTTAGVPTTGGSAAIETSGTSVAVLYPLVSSNADLTLATVVRGAVQDSGGNLNPEGDAAIGVPSSTTSNAAAGTTTAPDLVSVGGFRTSATGTGTIVDFTFDQAAIITGVGAVANEGATGAFNLVTVAGGETNCTAPAAGTGVPGGGTTPGGSGTTTISVECVGAITSGNYARGTVNTGAVVSTTSVPNVLSAADIGTGTSTSPDLVSASFTTTSSTVVYTFDQAVTSTTLASYGVYSATGVQSFTGTSATVDTAGGSLKVAVVFPAGTLTSAVGATVRDTAVTSTTIGNLQGNQQDEVGVANAATTSQTPGLTALPDLTSVAITKGTADAFGVQPNQATYTFDSTNASTSAITVNSAALFHLYSSAGALLTGVTCTPGNGGTAGAYNTVTCITYTSSDAVTTLNTQYGTAVLGTVEAAAITVGTATNPEGGAATTGGTGTPVNP